MKKNKGCGKKKLPEGYICGLRGVKWKSWYLCPKCDDWNLSEKIQYGYGCAGEDVIEDKDIKEFIKRLKEEMDKSQNDLRYSYIRNKIIDTLAGEELSG